MTLETINYYYDNETSLTYQVVGRRRGLASFPSTPRPRRQ